MLSDLSESDAAGSRDDESAKPDPTGDAGRNSPPSPADPALPGDVGWLLLLGGLIGFVAPGVLGLDLLALGALLVWPGNRQRIGGWLQEDGRCPRLLRGSRTGVNRFLANLERRYPAAGGR